MSDGRDMQRGQHREQCRHRRAHGRLVRFWHVGPGSCGAALASSRKASGTTACWFFVDREVHAERVTMLDGPGERAWLVGRDLATQQRVDYTFNPCDVKRVAG